MDHHLTAEDAAAASERIAKRAAEAARQARENLSLDHPRIYRPSDYLTTELIAHTVKLAFNARGEMIWTLLIPNEYRVFAEPLPDTYGVPLHIAMRQWVPEDTPRMIGEYEQRTTNGH